MHIMEESQRGRTHLLHNLACVEDNWEEREGEEGRKITERKAERNKRVAGGREKKSRSRPPFSSPSDPQHVRAVRGGLPSSYFLGH
uniref:Uncharacterized protein n=1 Tax=Caenorhabditis tropicalis TaxID=1561998 RepID=A0A1I7U0X1_9PELO